MNIKKDWHPGLCLLYKFNDVPKIVASSNNVSEFAWYEWIPWKQSNSVGQVSLNFYSVKATVRPSSSLQDIFSQGPGFMSKFLKNKDPFGMSLEMNSAVQQLEKEKKINNLYKLRKFLIIARRRHMSSTN